MGKTGIAVLQIVLIVLSIICGWLGYSYINQFSNQASGGGLLIVWVIVVTIVAAVVGFILNVILHEAGHLIFGLLTGYGLVFFSALGLTTMKENGKLVVKKYSIAGTAGGCMLSPPDMKNGTYPYKLCISGGFLVDFILCAVFLILFYNSAETAGLWARAFLVIGIVSALLGLLNFIPHNVVAPDDGYIFFNLGKEENATMHKGYWTCFKIQALLAEGSRPREIPTELFDWVDTDNINDPLTYETAYYHYKYLLDQQKFSDAKTLLQTLWDDTNNIPEVQKLACQCELLFHELIGDRRQEEIDRLYSEGLKKYIKAAEAELNVQRLMYTYARLYLKNADEAAKQMELFNKACNIPIQAGLARSENELISIIDEIADKR